MNGGFLVDIARPEGTAKVGNLAEKLRQVLGEEAVVSRPSIKGELRLIGLDDWTTADEARYVLADIGRCNPEDVKTGPIRKMLNGLGTVWAQCSIAAALQITKIGKIKIGWTVARLELLKARPLQCYRCWEFGHVRSGCKVDKNRNGTCYRCGCDGHNTRDCIARPSCAICTEKGRNGQHRMGSAVCLAANQKKRQSQTGRRTKDTTGNGS